MVEDNKAGQLAWREERRAAQAAAAKPPTAVFKEKSKES